MDNKNDNNFFNRNPILVFIIFSIVVVILFRLMVGESSSGVNGIIDGPKILNTQRVAYSRIIPKERFKFKEGIGTQGIFHSLVKGFYQIRLTEFWKGFIRN